MWRPRFQAHFQSWVPTWTLELHISSRQKQIPDNQDQKAVCMETLNFFLLNLEMKMILRLDQ